ncbi:MAG TPA: LytTR family DNA-binding domain-containing protein [Chitinophagaceae bacterium]|nr:LytTR family DNA-binding domain-containing protein [Chitinophagaceae bacterium]
MNVALKKCIYGYRAIMIKTVIVDDEPFCCASLVTLLERYCPEVKVAGICDSGEDALAVILEQQPQIVFLDIEMPGMNGFEMLEKLPVINFEIIFTTSYDQYAIKAIRFSALDYLLKPVDREELQKAVEKVIQRSNRAVPQQLEILLQKFHQPVSPIQKIALPSMEGLQMIDVNSIISCASDSNYTIFLLKNKKKLVISRTLKEIEELLDEYYFLRVHNSYLVNLNEVEKYIKGEGGYLVMSDGSHIDVSRSKKEMLLSKLRPNRT